MAREMARFTHLQRLTSPSRVTPDFLSPRNTMSHSSPWLRRTLLALAGLALAACSEHGDPAQRLLQSEAPRADSRAGWQKVAGSMPAFRVSAVIDERGGAIGVPGYTLTVLP